MLSVKDFTVNLLPVYQFIFLLKSLPSTKNMMNMKGYNDKRVPVDPPAKLASMTIMWMTVKNKANPAD